MIHLEDDIFFDGKNCLYNDDETEKVLNVKLLKLDRLENFGVPIEYMYVVFASCTDGFISRSKGWTIYGKTDIDNADKIVILFDETMSLREYLEALVEILDLAIKTSKKPFIYHAYERGNMRTRTMLDKVVNSWFDQVGGVLVYYTKYPDVSGYYRPHGMNYEPYVQQAVYTQDLPNHFFLQIDKLQNISNKTIRRQLRNNSILLYNDTFYAEIDNEEYIYMVLNAIAPTNVEFYNNLGVRYIPFPNTGALAYAKKAQFENPIIKQYVKPEFSPFIVTTSKITQQLNTETIKCKQSSVDKLDDGENVLIGILTTEDVDLAQPALIKQDGKSKVVYIWEQEAADTGKYITNISVPNKDPDTTLNLPTAMMVMSNCNCANDPNGLCLPKVEYVVAKLSVASPNMQRIYGGEVSDGAVLMEDVLIGTKQLIEYAVSVNKPIAICIPYGSNINSHDGTDALEQMLNKYSRMQGVTLITSTGEEGDKNLHSRVTIDETSTKTLKIPKDNQNIVGCLWAKYPGGLQASIYNLQKKDKYSLESPAVIAIGQGKIYTTGIKISADNGSPLIYFRLENVDAGDWNIDINLDHPDRGIVDMWISNTELNNGAVFRGGDPFVTIPSLGNIPHMMCVGAYDDHALTTTRESGRGYTREDDVVPACVVQAAHMKVAVDDNVSATLNGANVALAIMAGQAAAVYSIVNKKNMQYLPNTPTMTFFLTANLDQVDTVEYPNRQQGYGIFNLQNLKDWLLTNGVI
ncbi:MAG: hypothetical protein ATN35_10735 [Epulopiscium sp. Nele67-Bin004]|nr:MAG: hypothetical protein ATN35_10735 [Epulopiscium sp. Nele67-Bin004]